jgi:hypothetical protein
MAVQLGPKGWNPQTWHALSPLDQQWLQNTVRLLPFMLATLQNQGVKLEKGWTTWVQAATEMIHWSKLPVDLTHATNSIQEAVPSKLLPPDAAPTATKAPPKSKQAVAKSAKSAKTPKTAVTKKPAVTNKPAVTVKKATKTARSSSPRTAVVPKAKRRTP